MADLGFEITTGENSQSDFDLIANGTYPAMITKAELRDSRSGGQYVDLTYTLFNCAYANRRVWQKISVVHADAEVTRRGREDLGHIGFLCGEKTVRDLDVLLNKPLSIVVYSKHSDYSGKMENLIKKVKAFDPSEAVAPTTNYDDVPF